METFRKEQLTGWLGSLVLSSLVTFFYYPGLRLPDSNQFELLTAGRLEQLTTRGSGFLTPTTAPHSR